MNSKIITAIIIVILIGLGAYFWSSQNNNENMQKDAMEENDDTMMEGDTLIKSDDEKMMGSESEMMEKGSYESYSPDKLALANSGKVVLFFRASWCPTCRALDANIRSNLNSIPDNVTILDVDYDNSTTLKQKYGVTYQHTLVQVDSSGNQIAKWTGSPTLADLVVNIK